MARVCQLTGKKAMTGNNVSHSMRRTKRTFMPNLMKKTFYSVEEDKYYNLKVSAAAVRTINKKGFDAVLKDARAKGLNV